MFFCVYVCINIYHVHAWNPWRLKEKLELQMGVSSTSPALVPTSPLNSWAISPASNSGFSPSLWKEGNSINCDLDELGGHEAKVKLSKYRKGLRGLTYMSRWSAFFTVINAQRSQLLKRKLSFSWQFWKFWSTVGWFSLKAVVKQHFKEGVHIIEPNRSCSPRGQDKLEWGRGCEMLMLIFLTGLFHSVHKHQIKHFVFLKCIKQKMGKWLK